jgi:brefeldin A-resistance guanine nucleotide exchange factor 1
VTTLTQCRYESGEIASDETALQRFIDVLLLAMRDQLSKRLGDVEVCSVVETFFGLCVLPRSELFKRTAELASIEVLTGILDRIDETGFRAAEPIDAPVLVYPGTRKDDPEPLPPALAALEAELAAERNRNGELLTPQSADAQVPTEVPLIPISESIPPYSMASVMAILAQLVRLLELGEKRNTDRLRSLCLVIISDFVERHARIISDVPIVWSLIERKATQAVVQLLQSDSPALNLHLHQVIFSIFGHFRRRLIAQTEFLLATIVQLLTFKPVSGKPLPKVSKEFYLELLVHFCVDPTFLVDLYVLYECGPRFGYVFRELINALTGIVMDKSIGTNQQQQQQQLEGSYILALDILLTMLKMIAECPEGDIHTAVDPESLQKDLKLKSLLRESADLFNKNPKDAFAFLAENGLTSSPATPQEIAKFLRRTAGLDKKQIGEIMSKPTNADILRDFLADHELAGLEIDEALRVVLESFRLPGESQQISRIMEALAQAYYKNHKGVFKSEDAVFILAYSIVMLNTDQHNRQVLGRMSVDDFIRNNRGINDGENFEPAFLGRIYHAIREKEIVMPEEQAGEVAFSHIWNEQLKKYVGIAPVLHLSPYAESIIGMMWKPVLASFRSLIMSPKSETLSKQAVKGLSNLGTLAARFLPPNFLDELVSVVLVECLAFAEISSNAAGNQLSRYLAKSELFQALVKCFFDQFRGHGAAIRDGWRVFATHLLMLVQCGVVSLTTFDVTGDVTGSSSKAGSRAVSPRAETGLFSTLSQYLVSSPVDASGADGEIKSRAMEWIKKNCRLDEILRDSRFLPDEALQCLLGALAEQLQVTRPPLGWDVDTLVFTVDLIVHAAWSNRDRMATFWGAIFERFSSLAKELSAPALLREHAILGLGRLSLRCADRPEMQKEVVQFFQLLCYVPPDAFQHLAEPALSIVMRIVELDPPILHGTAIWPHYFTVLALAGRSRSCGPYAFGLLTTIVREDELLFPLDFYVEYVDLLNGFIASSTQTSTTASPLSASGEIMPTSVELASEALNKFALLEANVRRLAGTGIIATVLWPDYVIPVHCAIAQQCYHPVREIRQSALSLLQKTLLAVDYDEQGVRALLDEFKLVLIPLLEELQRPEMRRLDGNVEELQVRAATVVARIFLANLSVLFPQSATPNESINLWATLLGHLLRFLEGRSDILRESIPETIKNMLLVMAASGVLHPPMPNTNSELWMETWNRLDPVMPRAKTEIFEITTPRSSEPKTGFLDQSPGNDEMAKVQKSTVDMEASEAPQQNPDLNVGPQEDVEIEYVVTEGGSVTQDDIQLEELQRVEPIRRMSGPTTPQLVEQIPDPTTAQPIRRMSSPITPQTQLGLQEERRKSTDEVTHCTTLDV